MSAKSQHNNVLLAILGFTTVVVVVGIIGFFAFSHEKENIQGQVEVSEYRVSSKVPGRILEIRVKEGDYVSVCVFIFVSVVLRPSDTASHYVYCFAVNESRVWI